MADVLNIISDIIAQDKAQKKEQTKIMKEVQKKMKEQEVSEEEGDKEEYTKFFAAKLKKYGVKSPAELSDKDKKKFFDEVDADWEADNEPQEESLGDRVKNRMSEEEMQEPSDEELDKLADLVVQKLKDKADEEEDEEEEPETTEAEKGKKEKVEINPKMEGYHVNPHRRDVWMDALRKVRMHEQNLVEQPEPEDKGEYDYEGDMAMSQLKTVKSAVDRMMGLLKPDTNLPEWVQSKITKATDYLDSAADYLESEMKESVAEEKMTDDQMKKREKIVKSMKDKESDFKDRYGDRWKEVMYATATKMAMKEESELDEIFGLSAKEKAEKKRKEYEKKEKSRREKQVKIQKGYKKYGLQVREDSELDEFFDQSVNESELNEDWIDTEARKVEDKWESMSDSSKQKWMKKIKNMADDKGMSEDELMDVLDDYGIEESVQPVTESLGVRFARKYYQG